MDSFSSPEQRESDSELLNPGPSDDDINQAILDTLNALLVKLDPTAPTRPGLPNVRNAFLKVRDLYTTKATAASNITAPKEKSNGTGHG